MMLTFFCDESADETCRRVFAVSGIVGSEAEWTLAVTEWTARTKGVVFHAADCERAGDLGLYKDLTQILAQSYLAGFTVALDLVAFRELLPDALPDLPYFKCVSDLIGAAAHTATRFNAHNASDPQATDPQISLEFTFDDRKQSAGVAGTLYLVFRNQPEWATSPVLGAQLNFDNRSNPRIQIADLVAREAMKDLDRIVSGAGRPRRRSMQALVDTAKFRFIVRDRAYCETWRQRIDALGDRDELSPKRYAAWLAQTGRVQQGRLHDNLNNRLLYMGWLDRNSAAS